MYGCKETSFNPNVIFNHFVIEQHNLVVQEAFEMILCISFIISLLVDT